MIDSQLAPYYFPTTVVLIDDDPGFLAHLRLQLDPDLAVRTYTSPAQALERINQPGADALPDRECFAESPRVGGPSSPATLHDRLIYLDLSHIQRGLYSEQRFGEVSVVVVDYDMPSIDGLELCRRIDNPRVRKVLLTGKADEKLAVDAFNEGIIDRFVPKKTPRLADVLQDLVCELQRAYFVASSAPIVAALGDRAPAFLSDPELLAELERVRSREGIVEYYLSVEPPGLLCLDAKGEPMLIMVYTRSEWEQRRRRAEAAGAPAELTARLQNDRAIAWFWQSGGDYSPEYRDWESCIYPARQVRGRQTFLYSLVRDPPGLGERRQEITPYKYYLEIVDHLESRAAPGQ